MTCPGCGRGVSISIQMKVGGGQMAFCHCSVCEANFWRSSVGAVVGLPQVLELATTVRAPRRGPRPSHPAVAAVPERFRTAA